MLANCRRWIRAYPGDQLDEQLRGVGLGADNGTEQVDRGGPVVIPGGVHQQVVLEADARAVNRRRPGQAPLKSADVA
jgi:hypothetical protein